jgi:hypothetical protein
VQSYLDEVRAGMNVFRTDAKLQTDYRSQLAVGIEHRRRSGGIERSPRKSEQPEDGSEDQQRPRKSHPSVRERRGNSELLPGRGVDQNAGDFVAERS